MSKGKKSPPVFHPARMNGWHLNAVLGWSHDPDQLYASGYAMAAEMVAERAMQGSHQDVLIYPICFLYRHALEIVLKELIRDTEKFIRLAAPFNEQLAGMERVVREVEDELENTHSLRRLFTILEPRLKLVTPDEEIPEDVRSSVFQLHDMDPTGEVFRYPRRKGKEQPIFNAQTWFDIGRIVERLGQSIRFLSDGIGGWLAYETGSINDYISSLESEGYDWNE
jgi:hypothetical protein